MVAKDRLLSLTLIGALFAASSSVGAQNVDSIRKSYQLPVPNIARHHPGFRATPGTTVQSRDQVLIGSFGPRPPMRMALVSSRWST